MGNNSSLRRYVFAMAMLHFVKRELETLFVHRFSHGTMPFSFVFRKSVTVTLPILHAI